MIQIIDVCKVLCSACGNYLEGVAAVCGNQVVRLCWQDFQIRAMKRGDRPYGPCCFNRVGLRTVSIVVSAHTCADVSASATA